MSDNEQIKTSIELMCMTLVGQTVHINWRTPITVDFQGQAYLDARGVVTFDIDMEQPVRLLYLTALHEVSHCLAGHLERSGQRNRQVECLHLQIGPIVKLTQEEKESYEQRPEELEAQGIAGELDHFAKNRSITLFGNDDIENRITILSQVEFLRPEEKSNEKNT
jgi:hypothetical protein